MQDGTRTGMWYLAFVMCRALVTVFFLLTSIYCILNYTPFVFYHFIRPRVFGWVNQFVAWHHVWYCAAYVLSVITLLPDLKRPKADDHTAVLARRLSMAYVVVFGLVAEKLVVTPYLPKLWNDTSSLVIGILSFLPLLWLAVIDHVATRPVALLGGAGGEGSATADRTAGAGPTGVTDQRRVLAACVSAAAYLWLVHLWRTLLGVGPGSRGMGWAMTSVWALALNMTAMMTVYAILNGLMAVASTTRAPRAWEYMQVVFLAMAAIAGILFGIVFPNIAFGRGAPIAVSLVAGITLGLTWSGIALRRPRTHATRLSGLDLFIAPLVAPGNTAADRAAGMRPVLQAVGAIVTPLVAFVALDRVERSDWNFLVQKLIVIFEWVLTFGFLLGAWRGFGLGNASPRPTLAAKAWAIRTIVPPALTVAFLLCLAQVSEYLPRGTGDGVVAAEVTLDQYAGRDVSFKLLYDELVGHPGRDAGFYQYVQVNSTISTALELTSPDVRFSPQLSASAGPRPDIFFFVIDSMRRDYLSAFNPAVTFTPNIARFAGDSFAFQNAFTPYGGTALAVPSIWSGGMLLHRLYMPDFPRSDALEKLVDAERYRWYMSLDTHMAPLISPHPDLVQLDSERLVMQFDFCRTLSELEGKLNARTDGRPVFAFTLPQNLHISNRQHGAVPPGEHYPGFFEPYAAEVHRIDACFGGFLSYLRRNRLYDDSVIVLTTDHGDSLGEGGNWGHGVSIYPEVVRIPLIVHIPERIKSHVTTDLTRVTFSTDLVPTLYELLGHKTQNLGPLYGAPLFALPGTELVPRRTGAFLLASSYAATWGILRRNGRSLYIADLVNGREYAYDLTSAPIGARTRITDDERRVNQRWIRERIAELARLYRFNPEP